MFYTCYVDNNPVRYNICYIASYVTFFSYVNFFLYRFCSFLYPISSFLCPLSTFLYTPTPNFLYLSYSTPIGARSLLSRHIHPFGLYERSLQPAHTNPPATPPGRHHISTRPSTPPGPPPHPHPGRSI